VTPDFLARLEVVTSKLERMDGGAAAVVPAAVVEEVELSPMVKDFDAYLAGEVADYVAKAGKLGAADVEKQAALVQAAFDAQRAFLLIVSSSDKGSVQGVR